MHTFETQLFGKPATYTLEGSVLTRTGAEDQSADLAQLVSANLASIGQMGVCELSFEGGAVVTVACDAPADHAALVSFLQLVHDAVPDPERVAFVKGNWLVVGVVLAITVVVCLAAIALTLVSVPDAHAGKVVLVQGLGALSLVAGPFLAWRARPRRYDPGQVAF